MIQIQQWVRKGWDYNVNFSSYPYPKLDFVLLSTMTLQFVMVPNCWNNSCRASEVMSLGKYFTKILHSSITWGWSYSSSFCICCCLFFFSCSSWWCTCGVTVFERRNSRFFVITLIWFFFFLDDDEEDVVDDEDVDSVCGGTVVVVVEVELLDCCVSDIFKSSDQQRSCNFFDFFVLVEGLFVPTRLNFFHSSRSVDSNQTLTVKLR